MGKKRERLEVINDILASIRDSRNSIKPTRLLSASNLSPQMFKEYIGELTDKGLIEMTEQKGTKKFYSVTEKGFRYMEKYELFINFVDNLGL